MKNITFIIGTRPEAIKMAPIIREVHTRPHMCAYVCLTSQHKEMLRDILPVFDITPDYDLDIMRPGQSVNDVLVRVIERLPTVFTTHKPDMVLVQGDTATCLAGALAAFGQNIPVGHVEAGLRTYDLANPFPEEGYRQMVSRIATCHFAPTVMAAESLKREGIEHRVHVTGNTVIDALLYACDFIACNPHMASIEGLPPDLLQNKKPFVLITGHRRENFGAPFQAMCEAIRQLALAYPGMTFVYPVHLNPHVQKPVHALLGGLNNVYLIKPQPYLPFVRLMQHCLWILTDSGGIQEEAPALGKPVLVMRKVTERPEAIHAGTSVLVGTETESIVQWGKRLFDDEQMYVDMSTAPNPYGNGNSAKYICDIIEQ